MPVFRFYHPIEVRYADIDAQRHVNNVAFFAYMESARARYLQHLGLWDGKDFLKIGIIVAEAACTYKAAIGYGQPLRVGVRTARLGNKSLELHYTIEDADTGAGDGHRTDDPGGLRLPRQPVDPDSGRLAPGHRGLRRR